jgi:hypothetical protein
MGPPRKESQTQQGAGKEKQGGCQRKGRAWVGGQSKDTCNVAQAGAGLRPYLSVEATLAASTGASIPEEGQLASEL